MHVLRLAALLCLCALPAAAQQWNQLAYYVAWIGPEDMRNSSGVRLTSLGAVLQQDRANVHRFNIRHPQDEYDPVFGNQSVRAMIPQLYQNGGRAPGLEAAVASGQPFGVSVFVCGYGSTPQVIYLAGWGEDHSGCY
ncbi:hypothetical protein [Wenxinia marina]|uniref:Uncharacterized protein n=1 Tax=Wenxinia marina DSM 24838 TaxID=1123501 RepID=A0A0D0Q6Y5_9RHOB|nr:hypothetical protein [Wenxinia marina]KIQ68182.1 hypothetical protein Wenmar_03192 [Wenxinia marina DSM 24838]GGL76571.1 hypothetical protein GCM10011392_33760 [Wenxinia marina]